MSSLTTLLAKVVMKDRWEDVEYEKGEILFPSPTGEFPYLRCPCVYLWLQPANNEYDTTKHILVPVANNPVRYVDGTDNIFVIETSELGKDFIIPSDDTDKVDDWDAYFGQE